MTRPQTKHRPSPPLNELPDENAVLITLVYEMHAQSTTAENPAATFRDLGRKGPLPNTVPSKSATFGIRWATRTAKKPARCMRTFEIPRGKRWVNSGNKDAKSADALSSTKSQRAFFRVRVLNLYKRISEAGRQNDSSLSPCACYEHRLLI